MLMRLLYIQESYFRIDNEKEKRKKETLTGLFVTQLLRTLEFS